MNAVALKAETKVVDARNGFTVNDRGGRVMVRTRGNGTGTVLVFRGKARPKLIHV